MTNWAKEKRLPVNVSTHMPLARHDYDIPASYVVGIVSTHMPLARHDELIKCMRT